jgi:hypothetical protein
VYAYAPTGSNITGLDGPSGDLLIGGYNSSLGNATINWVPSPLNSQEPDAWYTNLTQFNINTTVYFNSTFTSPARFMTGILGIGLNSTLFASVCSQIQGMHSAITIDCSGSIAQMGLPNANSTCPAEAWNATISFGTG